MPSSEPVQVETTIKIHIIIRSVIKIVQMSHRLAVTPNRSSKRSISEHLNNSTGKEGGWAHTRLVSAFTQLTDLKCVIRSTG